MPPLRTTVSGMTLSNSPDGGPSGPCTECDMNPKYPHSAREHRTANGWVEPLVAYIKSDAFTDEDRPLTYQGAIDRFDLRTTARRMGRVLDAVELILKSRGWPPAAVAGVAAYVVTAQTGQPGAGWFDIWHMHPHAARQIARDYIRELTLAVD